MALGTPGDRSVELYSVIGGCFAVISALVGVLYNRLNKDAEGKQSQLDEGNKSFTLIRERLTVLETKCDNCIELDARDNEEVRRISGELARLHDDVVRLLERNHL